MQTEGTSAGAYLGHRTTYSGSVQPVTHQHQALENACQQTCTIQRTVYRSGHEVFTGGYQ